MTTVEAVGVGCCKSETNESAVLNEAPADFERFDDDDDDDDDEQQ
jgi:hypothetical protein